MADQKAILEALDQAGGRLAMGPLLNRATADKSELRRLVEQGFVAAHNGDLELTDAGAAALSDLEQGRAPKPAVDKPAQPEPSPARPSLAKRKAPSFRPRQCARCGREFQPTGPRNLYCGRDDCRAEVAKPKRPRQGRKAPARTRPAPAPAPEPVKSEGGGFPVIRESVGGAVEKLRARREELVPLMAELEEINRVLGQLEPLAEAA